MTPYQKIQKEIVLLTIQNTDFNWPAEITEENVDTVWELCYDYRQDAKEEFRSSGIDTGLECEWSRYYESKSVAKQLSDGSYIGFVYWFGGGKHGEPEEIDWMDDAYELEVTEVMMPIKQFKKK